ncbi:MAG: single-stranded DNA-binding protein [Methanobrevibacter sp.]|nr:single-stranded DNA-binding protein [Methanobrevibacter sp.]
MLNKLILAGRLTADPIWKEGKENEFATFTLAINQNPKDDSCEFIDCTCGSHLNNAIDHLHKGDKIAVMGRFSNRKFTRKDGSTGVSATLYVDELEFIDVKAPEVEEPAPEPVKEAPTPKTTRRAK